MSSMLSIIQVLLWSLILLWCHFTISCKANKQGEYLHKFIQSKRSQKPSYGESSFVDRHVSKEHVVEQQSGLKETNKVKALPGQPQGVNFDQYAGYVTVDAKAGRALFYYFVESPQNSSTKPLVLWLNGGPGCSSFGYGAMQELGPFRVNRDGRTLSFNEDAWNIEANIIFLESPAGVGFSYSNKSSDYSKIGDKSTAMDTYTFLLNWLERFPQYKTRDFFIAGESYAGHYVPQLAELILSKNKQMKNHTVINLKGIAIGNGWIDDNLCTKGMYDYFWMHALNSDETHEGIEKYCDFKKANFTNECNKYQNRASDEVGNIDVYNIYAPRCDLATTKTDASTPIYSGNNFDPCSEHYTNAYLNLPEVQEALHTKAQKWSPCSELITWTDSPATVLPNINRLTSTGINIWIYSGDIDGRVPITSTRYAVNALKLQVDTTWRPWYTGKEVGGYVIGYKGLKLVTVRGAGHMVPSHQPKRASAMFSYFLSGQFPPELTSETLFGIDVKI